MGIHMNLPDSSGRILIEAINNWLAYCSILQPKSQSLRRIAWNIVLGTSFCSSRHTSYSRSSGTSYQKAGWHFAGSTDGKILLRTLSLLGKRIQGQVLSLQYIVSLPLEWRFDAVDHSKLDMHQEPNNLITLRETIWTKMILVTTDLLFHPNRGS
jgi:hypothetical protein